MILVTEPDTDKLEVALAEYQYEWIKNRFGEEAADCANYGWSAETDVSKVGYCTKVYGHGYVDSEVTIDSHGQMIFSLPAFEPF